MSIRAFFICTAVIVATFVASAGHLRAQEMIEPIYTLPPIETEPSFESGLAPLPPVEEAIPDFGTASEIRPQSESAFNFGPSAEERAAISFKLFGMPESNLKNTTGRYAVSGEEMRFGAPLRMREDSLWLALAGVQRTEISGPFRLPDSGADLPREFWNIEFGVMHLRKFRNDWQSGTMLMFGSASDQPFGGMEDMTVTALGFLRIPAAQENAWIVSLFYSPTGQLSFPVPGIAYLWRPNERLEANLGIPFSLKYRATEALTITAGYLPLNRINLTARHSLGEFWNVYASYRTVNDIYLLDGRFDSDIRSFFFDQRASLGIQRTLGRGWSLDLSASYVFDRKYFQAERFTSPRFDVLSIDNGMAGTIQLQWNR